MTGKSEPGIASDPDIVKRPRRSKGDEDFIWRPWEKSPTRSVPWIKEGTAAKKPKKASKRIPKKYG